MSKLTTVYISSSYSICDKHLNILSINFCIKLNMLKKKSYFNLGLQLKCARVEATFC